MGKKILKIAVVFLLGTSFFLSAEVNVDGGWTLLIKRGKGEVSKKAFEFVQEGEKFDVYKKQKEGGKKKIGEGTVKGDQIEWTITREKGDAAAVNKFVGTVTGDTMKGELIVEKKGKKRAPREWTAKRKKPGKP